jgi:hypothetical protein
MSILCGNGATDTFPRFPDDILNSTYMINVTRVTLASTITVLPPFLCSLPSREVDLSNQGFTTLTNATFPCLDYFRKVNLAANGLTSVNMPSGNFTNLTSLDLSSNGLTSIPYSLLRPSPSSLSNLDLRNNSIAAIDLLLYTLKNIAVNLDGNPIKNLTIVNPQNVTVSTMSANATNSRVNLTLPATLAGQLFILSDEAAATARVCTPAGIETYIALTGLANTSVRLDCSCASIRLRVLYDNNGPRITDRFNCTSGTNSANYTALNPNTCSDSTNLITRCSDPPATVSIIGLKAERVRETRWNLKYNVFAGTSISLEFTWCRWIFVYIQLTTNPFRT